MDQFANWTIEDKPTTDLYYSVTFKKLGKYCTNIGLSSIQITLKKIEESDIFTSKKEIVTN